MTKSLDKLNQVLLENIADWREVRSLIMRDHFLLLCKQGTSYPVDFGIFLSLQATESENSPTIIILEGGESTHLAVDHILNRLKEA